MGGLSQKVPCSILLNTSIREYQKIKAEIQLHYLIFMFYFQMSPKSYWESTEHATESFIESSRQCCISARSGSGSYFRDICFICYLYVVLLQNS